MSDCCVREKTVEEYIFDLGNTELCHNYPEETKRIIALLKEREERRTEAHCARVRELEAELELKNTIIKCLAFRVQFLEG